MVKLVGHGLCACMAILCLSSCYRSTAVSTQAVSAFRVTNENVNVLPTGVESTGRIGDIVMQTQFVSVVLDGDFNTPHRNLYREHSGGAIVDFTTRFVDAFAEYKTRDDDGLQLLAQGINLNAQNPIGYDSIHINNIDILNSSIVLEGSVYDLDGSLASAGATTDAISGKVDRCYVSTMIEASNAEPTDNPEITAPGEFVRLTTVIRNESENDLPIFTVNDHVITPIKGMNVFVPYPGWGFERPASDSTHPIAYVPFVHFQPYQSNVAHYAAFSDMDAMVAVNSNQDYNRGLEHTMIGKVGRPGQVLAPGGELTFVREFYVKGASTVDETVYDFIANRFRGRSRDQSPYSSFDQLGAFTASFNYINAPDTHYVVGYRDQSIDYFDGSDWVTLGADETLPVFGTFRNNDPTISLALMPGKLAVYARPINSDPVVIDHRTDRETDDEGIETFTDVPIEIVVEESFDLGVQQIGQAHFSFTYGLATQNHERVLLSRIQVEPLNDLEYNAGFFPGVAQEHTLYLTSSLGAHRFVRGTYEMHMSRGPLHSVNIQQVTIMDVEDDEGNVTTPVVPSRWSAEMNQAIQLPGYLSADFEVFSNYDVGGFVDINGMLLIPYAEDLDVIFFMDRNIQPEIKDRFMSLALVQGSFDADDRENKVDSLFDEVAPSRCAAVTSAPTREFPNGKGFFGVMNLPFRDVVEFIDIPEITSDPAGFYDMAREIGPETLITLVRPRAPLASNLGLFSAIAAKSGLDQQTPLPADNIYLNKTAVSGSSTRWMDFDMIEILSGNRYDEYLLARADWFNLLNSGEFRAAVGGTGNGTTRDTLMGVVRTFIQVSNTDLRDNDLQDFWSNADLGHSFITNGPIIEAQIGSAGPGDQVSSATPQLTIKVRAAPWIPVPQMRIVVDGEVVSEVALSPSSEDETIRYNGLLDLDLQPGSHWVVVEAGAPLDALAGQTEIETGTFGKVNPGHLPIGFTNPIFIQVTGN